MLINQHQSVIDDHNSGRKLLTNEGMEYHKAHIISLRRKLAIAKQKDPIVSFVICYIYSKIYLCSIALRCMYLIPHKQPVSHQPCLENSLKI
jgi:hypothetical protein